MLRTIDMLVRNNTMLDSEELIYSELHNLQLHVLHHRKLQHDKWMDEHRGEVSRPRPSIERIERDGERRKRRPRRQRRPLEINMTNAGRHCLLPEDHCGTGACASVIDLKALRSCIGTSMRRVSLWADWRRCSAISSSGNTGRPTIRARRMAMWWW